MRPIPVSHACPASRPGGVCRCRDGGVARLSPARRRARQSGRNALARLHPLSVTALGAALVT